MILVSLIYFYIRSYDYIRWTVRADCMKSVLDNYSELLQLWERNVEEGIGDSEMKARILGIQSQMGKFAFLMCEFINMNMNIHIHTELPVLLKNQ